MRSKEEITKDIIYCTIGAKEENLHSNFGEEREWLNNLYDYVDEYMISNDEINL